jgi:ribosomal protein S18 acetylase RimI-like enzyme
VGAQLLRVCEDHLRLEGESAYTVHTHRDDNASGIRFYEREGFAIIGESRSFGDAFVVMRKSIT